MIKKSEISENEEVVPKHSKKKKLISIAIILIVVGAVLSGIFIPKMLTGQVQDEEITWDQDKGDVYYLGVRDDYFYGDRQNDDDFIRKFRTVLKSEILDKKDLEVDWDNDDDLVIMSSILMGKEDVYTIEFPNFLDLYTIFLTLNNIQEITNTGSPSLLNPMNFNEWAIPGAIHYQCSSVYHFLNHLLEQYNLNNITDQMQYQDFQSIGDLFNYLMLNTIYLEDFTEDFESDYIFETETSYPDNNSAQIITDPSNSLNKVLALWQDNDSYANSKDDLSVSLNLFEDWLSSSNFSKHIGNLNEYVYYPNTLNFDYEYGDNKDQHDIEFSLLQNEFDIETYRYLGEYGGITPFNGQNGIKLKIHQGYLQYFVGDFIYEYLTPDYPYDQDSLVLRQAFESEQGWKNFTEDYWNGWEWIKTPIYLPTLVYEGTSLGDRMSFQVELNPSVPYRATLKLMYPTKFGYYQTWEKEFPIYFDCPYDFRPGECYDKLIQDNNVFRSRNWTNLEFKVNGTICNDTNDFIDNLIVKGNVFWGMDNIDDINAKTVLSSLYLLSVYHLLFFPNQFPYETIVKLVELVNIIVKKGLNWESDFIIIDQTDEDILKFEIPKENIYKLRQILEVLVAFLGIFNPFSFIDGNVNASLTLELDKSIGCMKESYITIYYEDIGIIRKLGLELIAAHYGNVDQEEIEQKLGEIEQQISETEQEIQDLENELGDHSDEIDDLEKELESLKEQQAELEDGLIRIYDDYPSLPPSGWTSGDDLTAALEEYKQQMINEFLIVFVSSLIGTAIGSISVSYLILRRKLKKLDKAPKTPKQKRNKKVSLYVFKDGWEE